MSDRRQPSLRKLNSAIARPKAFSPNKGKIKSTRNISGLSPRKPPTRAGLNTEKKKDDAEKVKEVQPALRDEALALLDNEVSAFDDNDDLLTSNEEILLGKEEKTKDTTLESKLGAVDEGSDEELLVSDHEENPKDKISFITPPIRKNIEQQEEKVPSTTPLKRRVTDEDEKNISSTSPPSKKATDEGEKRISSKSPPSRRNVDEDDGKVSSRGPPTRRNVDEDDGKVSSRGTPSRKNVDSDPGKVSSRGPASRRNVDEDDGKVSSRGTPSRNKVDADPGKVSSRGPPSRRNVDEDDGKVSSRGTPSRKNVDADPGKVSSRGTPSRRNIDEDNGKVSSRGPPSRKNVDTDPLEVSSLDTPSQKNAGKNEEKVLPKTPPKRNNTDQEGKKVTSRTPPKRINIDDDTKKVTSRATPRRNSTDEEGKKVTSRTPPKRINIDDDTKKVTSRATPKRNNSDVDGKKVTSRTPPKRINIDGDTKKVTSRAPPRRSSVDEGVKKVTSRTPPRRNGTDEDGKNARAPPKRSGIDDDTKKVTSRATPSRNNIDEDGKKVTSRAPPSRNNIDEDGKRVTSRAPPSRNNIDEDGKKVTSRAPPSRNNIDEDGKKVTSRTPPSRKNVDQEEKKSSSRAPPTRVDISVRAGNAAAVAAAVQSLSPPARTGMIVESDDTMESSEMQAGEPAEEKRTKTPRGQSEDDGKHFIAPPSRASISEENDYHSKGQSSKPPAREFVSEREAREFINEREEDTTDKSSKVEELLDVQEEKFDEKSDEESVASPIKSREIFQGDYEKGFDSKKGIDDEDKPWWQNRKVMVAWMVIVLIFLIIITCIFAIQKPKPRSLPEFLKAVPRPLGEGLSGAEDIKIELGESLDFSLNGDFLAVGSKEIANSNGPGQVEVQKLIDNQWEQVGNTIFGVPGGNFGSAVQISADGTFLLVGSYGSDSDGGLKGLVSGYKLDGNEWKQFGSEIEGDYDGDHFGVSLSMSDDGSSWIVGADKYRNPEDNGLDGYGKVFELVDGDWVQKGFTIEGGNESRTGSAVAMSGDGSTICIGDRWYKVLDDDDGKEYQKGRARCFEWSDGNWTSKGDDIIGTSSAANGQMGFSISLSNNGNRVAVGDRDGGDNEQGSCTVFELKGGIWTRMGSEQVSADTQDRGGMNVKLNSEGDMLAWTAEMHSESRGAVIIMKWDNTEWVELGKELGTNETDFYGRSIAMSADGNRIAASAHGGVADYINAFEMVPP